MPQEPLERRIRHCRPVPLFDVTWIFPGAIRSTIELEDKRRDPSLSGHIWTVRSIHGGLALQQYIIHPIRTRTLTQVLWTGDGIHMKRMTINHNITTGNRRRLCGNEVQGCGDDDLKYRHMVSDGPTNVVERLEYDMWNGAEISPVKRGEKWNEVFPYEQDTTITSVELEPGKRTFLKFQRHQILCRDDTKETTDWKLLSVTQPPRPPDSMDDSYRS